MILSQLRATKSSPTKDLFFTGLNRNEFISDDEIRDGYNLSTEYIPAISQRLPRFEMYPKARLTSPNYLFNAGGKLCWIDGNSFYYDGVSKGTVDGTKAHSMVDFNGFVVIFPEKLYYCYDSLNPEYEVFGKFGVGDCEDASLFDAVDATISASTTQFKYGTKSIKCISTGATGEYGCKTKGYGFKVDEKQYYVVTGFIYGTGSARIDVFKGSNGTTMIGSSVTTTLTGDWKRLAAVVIPANLTGEKYIIIQVTMTSTGIGQTFYVDGLMTTVITEKNYTDNVQSNENWLASHPFMPTPDIDFCSQHYNRVFGCKGSAIYASAWGDFKTWSKFEGTNQDSYATDVATEGDFTGMFTYDSHVTFFKDNFIEELFGTLPRNFTLMGMTGFGAISNEAIAEGGGYMLFADKINVYSYTGGRPNIIGQPLNEKGYSNVKIASDGERFYVLIIRTDDDRQLYCYDTRTKTWMPEDDLDVIGFTTLNQKVYALDSTGRILKLNAGTESIPWSVETKTYDDGIYEHKRYKNIKLKLKMESGSTISIYSKKDDGEWVLEHTVTNSDTESYVVVRKVVKVNRANRYQLKFTGAGEVLIYGEREFDVVSQF